MVKFLGWRVLGLAPLKPSAKVLVIFDPDFINDISTTNILAVGMLYVQGSLANEPRCQYVTPPRGNEIWAKK